MKQLRSTLLTVTGILSVIFGVVCFSMGSGHSEYEASYGGDAYTGIQNAAAQTANNVQDLTKNLNKGMGFMLLIAGFTLVSLGVTSLEKKEDKKEPEKKQEPTFAPASPSANDQDDKPAVEKTQETDNTSENQ